MIYDVNGLPLEGSGDQYKILRTGASASGRPYWVLHLDCGRKFFSVANIKTIIDTMHTNGLNQLQLHFSEDRGFRFALNDMTVITPDGDEYDLSGCVSTDLGGSLSESNMNEIISYARTKGIEVVPSLDMPGHMSKLLTQFTQFRYDSRYAWTLNVKDKDAVNFALAIVEKYAKYFLLMGCEYWNIGADEVGSQGGNGRWKYLNEADIPAFVEFVNTVADLVSKMGLIPRAFNDGVLYNADYANLFNRNIEIYNWCSANLMGEPGIQNVDALVENGYKLINTRYDWYLVVPRTNERTSHSGLERANLLKNYYNGTTTHDQCGACLAVWCDNDTTNDGGDAAMTSILGNIASMGTGIGLTLAQLDYPIITS